MFIYFIILILTYYCYKRWFIYQKYTSQGIQGPTPLPLINNIHKIITKTFADYEAECFRLYGSTYVDFLLDGYNGTIITCKPELLKRILIKDFHKFSHRVQPPAFTPNLVKSAVIFQNEGWKRIRSLVTPVFSSGRLKRMCKNFKEPVQTSLTNIDKLIENGQNQQIDIKKLMKAFSLDVIGNVCFSLKTDAWNEDDFSQRVTDLLRPNPFLIFAILFLPFKIVNFFKISFINKDTVNYFAKMASNLIEERKKNKDLVYNDFIEMLLKSEVEGKVERNYEEDGHINKELSLEEIVAQTFIFYVAGLETIGTALSALLYELAIHENIQTKLVEELNKYFPDNDEVVYEDIFKCEYLNAVIDETLRKHTTLNRVSRKAIEDCDLGDFKVKKGQSIGISLYNLHNNPNLYPEPEKFKPERFITGELAPGSDTFRPIPFVDGPRNCIGNRFALIEMKSLLIPLMKKYRVFTTSRTQIPIRSKKSAVINIIEDVNLGLELRV